MRADQAIRVSKSYRFINWIDALSQKNLTVTSNSDSQTNINGILTSDQRSNITGKTGRWKEVVDVKHLQLICKGTTRKASTRKKRQATIWLIQLFLFAMALIIQVIKSKGLNHTEVNKNYSLLILPKLFGPSWLLLAACHTIHESNVQELRRIINRI